MNKESIKSAILIVLVGISLFFTWNMWSLQPTYEEFQNQTFFESIPITEEKRVMNEVIKPQQIFIHSNESHNSPTNGDYLESIWKEMKYWEYSSEKALAFTKEEFKEWIHDQNRSKIELRFYDEIPIETFQSMLEWDDESNEILAFDRIYLEVVEGNEVQNVYFVSFDKMKIIETSVTNPEASRFVLELYSKRNEFPSYFIFNTKQGNEIMLPEHQIELNNYQYLTEEIEGEKFKNALFSNPRIVKQDVNGSRNRYTDGTRELNIFPSNHLVRYVNPTLTDTNSIEDNILIEQSIAFLNDHGGWTDNYLLFNVNELNQEVKLILSIGSIPVINSMDNLFGPTMITQRWGQNEVAIYDRPSYQLNASIPSDTTTLMSGKKVEKLIQDQQIDVTEIDNIYIAYELGGSENQQFVRVSPVWCIEMENGQLIKINEVSDENGGDENGVE